MHKRYNLENVFDASKKRIGYIFDNFEKIYVSFSGGKDSTVMLHIVLDEAIKRNRKVGVMIIDLEGQYDYTINHMLNCVRMYKDNIELFWCCLPLHLRNAVSVYETHWICWDLDKKGSWIRQPPKEAITDINFFPFMHKGIEFEEFENLYLDATAEPFNCLYIDSRDNTYRRNFNREYLLKDNT